MGVRLVANTVTFTSNANVFFCIPSTLSSYLTLITTTSNPINMDGRITLNVGNAVPPSLILLNSTGADTLLGQWNGLFQSVSAVQVSSIATSAPPCFATSAAPSYASVGTSNTVTIAFSQSNSGSAGCVPVSTGLSGGAIAGIIIGSFVGAALLIIGVIFVIKKFDFDNKRQLFSRTKIHAAESSVPM